MPDTRLAPSARAVGATFDANVTGFRVAPTGMMNGTTVLGNPSFTVRFRVQVR